MLDIENDGDDLANMIYFSKYFAYRIAEDVQVITDPQNDDDRLNKGRTFYAVYLLEDIYALEADEIIRLFHEFFQAFKMTNPDYDRSHGRLILSGENTKDNSLYKEQYIRLFKSSEFFNVVAKYVADLNVDDFYYLQNISGLLTCGHLFSHISIYSCPWLRNLDPLKDCPSVRLDYLFLEPPFTWLHNKKFAIFHSCMLRLSNPDDDQNNMDMDPQNDIELWDRQQSTRVAELKELPILFARSLYKVQNVFLSRMNRLDFSIEPKQVPYNKVRDCLQQVRREKKISKEVDIYNDPLFLELIQAQEALFGKEDNINSLYLNRCTFVGLPKNIEIVSMDRCIQRNTEDEETQIVISDLEHVIAFNAQDMKVKSGTKAQDYQWNSSLHHLELLNVEIDEMDVLLHAFSQNGYIHLCNLSLSCYDTLVKRANDECFQLAFSPEPINDVESLLPMEATISKKLQGNTQKRSNKKLKKSQKSQKSKGGIKNSLSVKLGNGTLLVNDNDSNICRNHCKLSSRLCPYPFDVCLHGIIGPDEVPKNVITSEDRFNAFLECIESMRKIRALNSMKRALEKDNNKITLESLMTEGMMKGMDSSMLQSITEIMKKNLNIVNS